MGGLGYKRLRSQAQVRRERCRQIQLLLIIIHQPHPNQPHPNQPHPNQPHPNQPHPHHPHPHHPHPHLPSTSPPQCGNNSSELLGVYEALWLCADVCSTTPGYDFFTYGESHSTVSQHKSHCSHMFPICHNPHSPTCHKPHPPPHLNTRSFCLFRCQQERGRVPA